MAIMELFFPATTAHDRRYGRAELLALDHTARQGRLARMEADFGARLAGMSGSERSNAIGALVAELRAAGHQLRRLERGEGDEWGRDDAVPPRPGQLRVSFGAGNAARIGWTD